METYALFWKDDSGFLLKPFFLATMTSMLVKFVLTWENYFSLFY